jgi:wobble nucleotide-excising tRNase
LLLEPVETNTGEGKFKFEIRRNGKKAYHMSEGECTLVSFCYFIAKLDDINTKGNIAIIWIDDPVSSLDANHVFFIYSLINGEIVKPRRYKQLFISTHNLDFLKYLKRLKAPGKDILHLLVQRYETESTITEMPDYMSKYVTEFNYLFHQIYKCSNVDVSKPDGSIVFYDFGNNARKYLELLLAFKFPNPNKNDDEKLEKFLGNSAEALLVDRINNEYSHLHGAFERGIIPVDIPEMKKAAQFLLDKTYEHDKDQYNSLMESIGEQPRTM